MKSSKIRQNVFPVLAALIWGTAFVAQSVSTDFVEPFTFNCLRFFVGFAVLLLINWIFARLGLKGKSMPGGRRSLIIGGVCCGVLLAAASNLQQFGLQFTTAGKAGFITTLYVVLVPLFGLALGRKARVSTWISVGLSVVGLYLLCMKGSLSIQKGDLYVLICAVVFALHILCIDHFAPKTNGLELSCVQFLTAGIVSGLGMLFTESPDWAGISRCVWPILYVGIFSSGVAYTLQILAQKGSDPTVVTILLSLESVFSVLAGAVILGDRLSAQETVGCAVMFAAVILAQLPAPLGKKYRRPKT